MEPLAICFVWNKEDDRVVKKYIDYTTELLTRDLENPFSRNLDLPIFYFSNSQKENTPMSINILANKVIVYIFVGENMVAAEEWEDYIKKMVENPMLHIVPVALDKTAFNIEAIKSLNYIREYEYEKNKQQNSR